MLKVALWHVELMTRYRVVVHEVAARRLHRRTEYPIFTLLLTSHLEWAAPKRAPSNVSVKMRAWEPGAYPPWTRLPFGFS